LNEPLPLLAHANRALAASWARGRWSPPTLDPDRIEAYAAGKEGVSSVPGRHWREPFRVLLADLEREARLSPLGRVIANGQMVKLLRARCRAERLSKRHPQIAEQPIERPVIIMGPMRSGTTRLQRLLACDPRFRATRLFETLEPVPYRRGLDRRLASGAAVTAFLRSANPAVHRVHPTGPLQPEEEFGHLSYSMHGAQFEVQWNVPNFALLGQRRDTHLVYDELRNLLQLNAWAGRESGARTWLLKCPQYTADPQSVMNAFPDAHLLCLSRDPVAVVGSSASLVTQQRRIHSDAVDPHAIGREWLGNTVLRARRMAEFRAANRHVPQLDLRYEEVGRDWRAAVARIYAFLGWQLPPQVLARMSRYLSSAKAHRGHRYNLTEFGLTEEGVRSALAGGAAAMPSRKECRAEVFPA
jgi:hypothetical protein